MRTNYFFGCKSIIKFMLSAVVVTIAACSTKQKLAKIDPDFAKYINSYTSGVVSKKSAVRIQLAGDADISHAVNEPIKENLFSFSPSVKGKAYWVDARTIEFKPEQDLSIDELYEVNFSLGKTMNVPSKFKNFVFNIQTVKPAFELEETGLRCITNDVMTLSGKIITADVETSDNVEKILSVFYSGSGSNVKWQHNEANKIHEFFIEDIKKSSSAGSLELKWDGSSIKSGIKGTKTIEVPASGDFKVLAVKAAQDNDEYVLVQFSELLNTMQQFEGLVTLNDMENLSYTVAGSELKVYAPKKLEGNYTVYINEGVRNSLSKKTSDFFSGNVFFENRLPSVQIQGKGVILPSSGDKVILPFEAVNLSAVDISIIKIYENNIAQFLQYNTLDGKNELRRVGSPLVQATIRLDDDKSLNLHKRNRFSLDLDKYIKTEPGAIYNVNIGFRPEYSLYPCNAAATTTSNSSEDDEEEENYYDYDDYGSNKLDDYSAFWNRYNNYYPYGYSWSNRDNPCSKSYYNKERFASRNILATNIGLSAKRGNDNTLLVAVNDIISTEPMNGVDLQVLDYQQQTVGKGSSNGDGIAMIDLKRKPYLLIAKKGEQKSYLILDDGSSLSLARFDVGGAEIKNGIKGYIFGERGVWRPGDSLFLGCIIEDKNNNLPQDHPIEMELISPRGQLYKRMVLQNAEDGFNVFKTATDAGAPTGNWLCRVKAGGATFEKQLKIETVMPNRLKIDLNFNGLEALGKGVTTPGTLSAKWLFGATAQNLKARIDAQLYAQTTKFAKFADYIFDDPTSYFTPQSKTIFDGTLNAEGAAAVSPSFDAGARAPGMLLANLMVKVFEPGGNFSIDNVSMPYHPYSSYAGVHVPDGDKQWGYLFTNKTHKFDIVNVNTDGALLQGAGTAEVEIYKIQWRWWWDNSDNISNFTQDNYNKLIKKETVQLNNGKGNFDFKPSIYGRYLILVKDKRSGHSTGKIFWADDDEWQTHNDNNDASSATMLAFSSDKSKYNVGEEVKLTIPSGKEGRALISIETGSKTLKTYWVNTKEGETKFNFKAEKEMLPNIYVNVSLMQPHAQTVNDLPIRMYGVIPISVEDKNTVLKPEIKMNDVIKPEQNTSVTVSEAGGKSMTYVIAVVDEGLLDLTRFKTPNPHNAFYAKEALGVKSWDVYDYVIGAWGTELERILTIGGDGESELAAKTRKANRFKAVVQFLGPFKSNGSAKTHNFTLPSYMGSVRVMVVAAGNGAYGMAEKSVKVKKPLMLLATLPRVLGPQEELKIPVTDFATENNIKNVSLSLQSNPFIQAEGNQNVTFSGTGEQ
ncbi:MAG: hypothetical protein LBE82_10180, partial [Chitinophagaceae bacterium]|nr:hypothetical protein [Chitinophagaceae bacterium]